MTTRALVRDLLEKRSGGLLVQVSEEGANIKVDGVLIGVSPLPEQVVAGGVHLITIEKEGFVVFRTDVEITENDTQTVTAHLLPSEEFKRTYREKAGTLRALAYTGIGLGLAGMGGGTGLYLHSRTKSRKVRADIKAYNQADVPDEELRAKLARRREKIATFDAVAIAAAGAGLVAFTTGVILFAVGDDPDRLDVETRVDLAAVGASTRPLTVGLTPQGFVIGGRF